MKMCQKNFVLGGGCYSTLVTNIRHQHSRTLGILPSRSLDEPDFLSDSIIMDADLESSRTCVIDILILDIFCLM